MALDIKQVTAAFGCFLPATLRCLRQLIEENRFREDLYPRLYVVPVRVPALRERPEDVPLLVDFFVTRSAETLGLSPRPVADDALAVLQCYEWPGNVRQLRNLVERLLIMAPGKSNEQIELEMLPPEIVMPGPATTRDRSREIMTLPLREAREQFERDYLLAQIQRFGGNVSKTAEYIGMERSALHRKLKSLGVVTRLNGIAG